MYVCVCVCVSVYINRRSLLRMRKNESTINMSALTQVKSRMRKASWSLSVHAINVVENESKTNCGMRARTLDTVNDLIYVRIERIRPLGHHGRLGFYVYTW